MIDDLPEGQTQHEGSIEQSVSTAELGVTAPIKQTHGFLLRGHDGNAERAIHVLHFDNGSYELIIETSWKGAAAPIETRLTLSAEGFSMLASALMEAAINLPKWETPNDLGNRSAAFGVSVLTDGLCGNGNYNERTDK